MAFRPFDFSALRDVFRVRNFAVFTAGNSIALLGSWVQRLAVGWLTWDLTESATWLGLVSMAELAPAVFLAPLFGVMSDRFDRRRVAIIGQYFCMAQAAALAVLTLTGTITPILLLLLQLMSGIIQPLIQTARLVLVPNLVPRERVGNAVAVNSLTFNTSRVLGPMLGGVLMTALGVGWLFAVNAVSYVAVIYALSILHLPPHRHIAKTSLLVGLRVETIEGWRYVVDHPILRWMLPTLCIAGMFTWSILDLMPGIADKVFGQGATGLSLMMSAQGVGAILGGLFLAQRPSAKGTTRIVLIAMFANGLLLMLLSVTSIFSLALVLLLATNFFTVMVGVGSQSLTQLAVADHMRGRALSAWYTVSRAGPAVGVVVLGFLASIVGFGPTLFLAGAIPTALAATMWYRKRGELPRPAPE